MTVYAGAAFSVPQGVTFTSSGSFSNYGGSGPWTATVNYGDGTGTQPLVVNVHAIIQLSHIVCECRQLRHDGDGQPITGVVGRVQYRSTVSGFTVNDGSPQQSMVNSLTYTVQQPDPDRAGRPSSSA